MNNKCFGGATYHSQEEPLLGAPLELKRELKRGKKAAQFYQRSFSSFSLLKKIKNRLNRK